MTAAQIADFEARLRVLEDDKAIRELISAYCYHADSGHDDELLALFTEDGVLASKVGGRPKRPPAPTRSGPRSPTRRGTTALTCTVTVCICSARTWSLTSPADRRHGQLVLAARAEARAGVRRLLGQQQPVVAAPGRRDLADRRAGAGALADEEFEEMLMNPRSAFAPPGCPPHLMLGVAERAGVGWRHPHPRVNDRLEMIISSGTVPSPTGPPRSPSASTCGHRTSEPVRRCSTRRPST